MSTLTAASPSQAGNGISYFENVSSAARALFSALFAVTSRAAVVERTEHVSSRDLFRLYKLAGQSDSVMPNLTQELQAIAKRSY